MMIEIIFFYFNYEKEFPRTNWRISHLLASGLLDRISCVF